MFLISSLFTPFYYKTKSIQKANSLHQPVGLLWLLPVYLFQVQDQTPPRALLRPKDPAQFPCSVMALYFP